MPDTHALVEHSSQGQLAVGCRALSLSGFWRRLEPISIDHMPLCKQPPRESRFGSPLNCRRFIGCGPEMVEVRCAEWVPDRLLRLGEHGDKPATDVRRCRPG
jgi:hypothetical protein